MEEFIRSLLKDHECIWFFVEKEDRKEFAEVLKRLGVSFEKFSPEDLGPITVLHRDRTLHNQMILFAILGFDDHYKDIPKLDWTKLRDGKEDPFVRENPFSSKVSMENRREQ